MNRCPRLPLAAAAALGALALTACAGDPSPATDGQLHAGDFVAPATAPASTAETSALAPGPPPAPARPAAPATAPAPPLLVAVARTAANAYNVDGMIGQVNGQPLYAAKLFEPLDVTLTRLGSDPDIPRDEFRRQARQLIRNQLNTTIEDALLFGEAQRDLPESERGYVEARVHEYRDELIRKWGAGAPILADSELREKKGRSLDQMLEEYRQHLIIGRYINLKVVMKINITRRDIERYYYTHPDQFNPKPGRVFRLISCDDPDDADKIDAELAAGKSFVTVASSDLNHSAHRDEGGLYSKDPLVGNLGLEPLNDALMKLHPGQASPRVTVGRACYWLYLETLSAGRSRPLREVQQTIEDMLKEQAYRREQEAYRQRLFTEGSFNPLNEMTAAMVDIAMARYAQPD
jgi:hypothetical protein